MNIYAILYKMSRFLIDLSSKNLFVMIGNTELKIFYEECSNTSQNIQIEYNFSLSVENF